MYDDNSTGGPEKYTKEQFQKMEKERFAAEARENAERDKEKAKEEAKAKKEARLNAEYDKIRGEIGVNQATKARRDKDIKSGQASLLLDDPYKDPNRAEMEKRAVKDQDAKAARSSSKGGGGGGAGIPKVGPKRPTEMKKGGKVSSASKRADGIAIRGKTRA